MNGNDELPTEHFWDTDAAEEEYHAVERGIAEAEQSLALARGRVLSSTGLYDHFERALYAAKQVGDYERVYKLTPTGINKYTWPKPKGFALNHALNPYWLTPDGRVTTDGTDQEEMRAVADNLTMIWAKSVEEHAWTYYGRLTRSGALKQYKINYTYTRQAECYRPTGEAAVSGLELKLKTEPDPFGAVSDMPAYSKDVTNGDALRKEPGEVQQAVRSQFRKLHHDLVEEVRAFTTSLYQGMRLWLYLDLAPVGLWVNGRLEALDYGWVKPGEKVELAWPALAHQPLPEVGQRRALPDPDILTIWITCGLWITYTFPEEQLEAWLRGMRQRLEERVTASVKQVVRTEHELRLLRQQREKILTLHYKPLAYKEFWSV